MEAKDRYAKSLIRERWYIIKTSTSKMYDTWYYVVMTTAIFNSIWTPLTISFNLAIKMGGDPNNPMYWMDQGANIIFAIDILVHFFCSYLD